jgi:hypothetical protein
MMESFKKIVQDEKKEIMERSMHPKNFSKDYIGYFRERNSINFGKTHYCRAHKMILNKEHILNCEMLKANQKIP